MTEPEQIRTSLNPPESFCSSRAYLYQWHMRGGELGSWPGLTAVCDNGLSARGEEVEAPNETTYSAGIGGPESVLPGWLWRIPGDDNQQFHIYSGPDDYPTGNLGAIADAHN